MKLGPNELASLRLLMEHREKPLDRLGYVRGSWKSYVGYMALVTVACAACLATNRLLLGGLLGGYIAGVLCRDYQWIGRQIDLMPLTRRIIDWNRVEEMLRESEEKC